MRILGHALDNVRLALLGDRPRIQPRGQRVFDVSDFVDSAVVELVDAALDEQVEREAAVSGRCGE